MKVARLTSISLYVGFVGAVLAPMLPAAQNVPSAQIDQSRLTIASRPLAPSQRLLLPAAGKAMLGAIDDTVRDRPSPRHGVARVAVHRSIPSESVTKGTWQTLNDGTRVWRLALNSTNALGLRLHLTNFNIGTGQVWVHDTDSPASKILGPYTGSGPLGKGDFWTGTIFGETIEIEYQAPADAMADSVALPFTIAELIHIYRMGQYESPRATATAVASRFRTAATTTPAPLNTSCFLDATCYQSNPVVAAGSHATSYIQFSDYQCTATILNAPNQAPLILTAGHCVNNETDAEGTEAFFDFRTASCGQDANAEPTAAYFNSLPYANGIKLLAYSNSAFLDGTSTNEIQNDLDFSLIELQQFPNASDIVLAGYTTTDLKVGDAAISLSHALGEYMKVAFGTRVAASTSDGSYFVNSYEIDQSSSGRVDSGSSGSGLFNSSSSFVGLLSTVDSCPTPNSDGSCPASYTSCQSPTPFDAFYTKFSAIYPLIATYLNQPVKPASSDPSVFYANPNPISVTDGSGLGQTTFFFNDPSKSAVEVRVGSPSGPLLSYSGGVGQAPTEKWVTDGLVFYLQDATQGDPTSGNKTLATVTVTFATASFAASPSAFPQGTYGSTILSWSAPNSESVEIWVGTPTSGPETLFARSDSFGTITTPTWVTSGLTFYLLDGTTRQNLSDLTIQTSAPTQAIFLATPNPIIVPSTGPALGITTLQWSAPSSVAIPNFVSSVQTVQVRVGSPSGPLFVQEGPAGGATTGPWVTDGMTFFLQNVTNGRPLTSANTLATTTVRVVQQ